MSCSYTEAWRSVFFLISVSLRETPLVRPSCPLLINNCPARLRRLEVGPGICNVFSAPDVKFDGDCFWVRDALEAICRIWVEAPASRIRPRRSVFSYCDWPWLSIQLVGLFGPILPLREFIFIKVESKWRLPLWAGDCKSVVSSFNFKFPGSCINCELILVWCVSTLLALCNCPPYDADAFFIMLGDVIFIPPSLITSWLKAINKVRNKSAATYLFNLLISNHLFDC